MYSVIIADPPWDVRKPAGWGRSNTAASVPQTYPTMSIDDITKMPVAALCKPTSYLFLWTVNRYVEEAYSVARAWGFSPTTLVTWCKTPVGMGPGGHFANTTEFILYARRGTAGKFGVERIWNTSWFNWPRGRQSEKPEVLQSTIEDRYAGPYAELFARRVRPGWDCWGNEVPPHPVLTPHLAASYSDG